VHTARASVLSGAVLLGTEQHDQTGIAEALQSHGAELSVTTDPDRLLFGTTLLAEGLGPVLALLAELLTSATYPGERVEGERDRVAERIGIARSQPGVIARTALAARRYGSHPYAVQLPDPELVLDVRAPALRRMHGEHVLPAGSSLVLVGDLDPERATDAVAEAMSAWVGVGTAHETPPAPENHPPGIELVDRPGAVQSNVRLGGPAPRRTDPDLAAVRLANMIFGGYFSSRLVENIRERRGYTYSPRSSVDHQAAGSSFLVEADVATEVTGPALLETWYELGRMALSTATHAGLASTLSALVGAGLPPDWLTDHQRALAGVTLEEVQEASRRYLAAAALTTVVVGDAARVAEQLRTLAPVEISGGGAA
jgi:predicted Zn-dependent peptidase